MLIRFYIPFGDSPDSDRIKERVRGLATSLGEGVKQWGDEIELVHNGLYSHPHPDVDVACCWGIKGNAPQIMKDYVKAGKRTLLFDKAFIRKMAATRWGHYRVGMDGPSPLKYLMREYRNFDRWESHRIAVKPKQVLQLTKGRGSIVYAGSSQKYCDYYVLGDANDYAEDVFRQVNNVAKKYKLVYRPKPSWTGYREIEGTFYSGPGETLDDLLGKAYALVTHGSAAAVEALVHGVPAITLGPCIAKPVANLDFNNLNNLYFPAEEARYHWLCNVAYCQWTELELKSGEAWRFLRRELEATK